MNVTGSTDNTEYHISSTNNMLDIGHSADETYNVTTNLSLPGRNVVIEAGTVNVLGATISTGSLVGNGGNITLIGKHVTIDNGAVLDTRTSAGPLFHAGDIEIDAVENRAQITALGFANVDILHTDINVGAATIESGGGNILFNAVSDSTHLLLPSDFGSNPIAQFLGATVLGGILSAIENLSVFVGVAYAESTAKINIGTSSATATIMSGNRITLETSAAVAVNAAPIAFVGGDRGGDWSDELHRRYRERANHLRGGPGHHDCGGSHRERVRGLG